jgi:hypothetical protein
MLLIYTLFALLVNCRIVASYPSRNSKSAPPFSCKLQPLQISSNEKSYDDERDFFNPPETRSTLPSKALKDMISDRDFFSDASITQFEVDRIVNSELPMLSSRDVIQFMYLTIKLSKRRRIHPVSILPRHLPLVVECFNKFTITNANARDMATLIYSLQGVWENDIGAKDFLILMTKIVNISLNDSKHGRFTSQGVSMTLFGLRSMSSESLEVRNLLRALKPKVERCSEEFNVQEIGNALNGLKGMSSDHSEVRAILSALVPKVQSCSELDAQAIGNALFGMKRMSSDHSEVRAMISALVPKVQSCSKLDNQAIGNALFGMKKMSSDHAEVRAMILALVPKVQSCKEELKAQAVGNALFGLQGMSSDHPEVRALLLAMVPKVQSCREDLKVQAVGTALFGMRRMSSDHHEVCAMISALVPKIQSCREELSSQAVGNALFGVQGLSSDHPEARAMLLALAPKVQSCREDLKVQEVSNALYGLQGMSSDHPEVCAILSALVPKVRSCRDLDAQAVGNALFGLQRMSSDYPEVREILLALSSKVQSCREDLKAQAVGNALFGLQGLSSDHQEVRAILLALAPKVESCREELTAQQVSNALYGLQGMSGDHPEVRAILLALVPKVRSCRELDAQGVGNALYGLQGLSHSVESSLIIDILFSQLVAIAGVTSQFQTLSSRDLVILSQNLAQTLPELRGALADKYDKWEKINLVLTDELASRRIKNDPYFNNDFRSNVERRVYSTAKKLFDQKPSVLISSNEYLFNLFESDIVLRIPISNNPDRSHVTMNIEVDGIHHKHKRTERFSTLRDKYLTSKGVAVFRIKVTSLGKMQDDELERLLVEKLSVLGYDVALEVWGDIGSSWG